MRLDAAIRFASTAFWTRRNERTIRVMASPGNDQGPPPPPHLRVHDGMLGLVGATPMVRLRRLPPPAGAGILVKLEYTNPSGSLKDRIALRMLEEAERRGDLRPGMCVASSC